MNRGTISVYMEKPNPPSLKQGSKFASIVDSMPANGVIFSPDQADEIADNIAKVTDVDSLSPVNLFVPGKVSEEARLMISELSARYDCSPMDMSLLVGLAVGKGDPRGMIHTIIEGMHYTKAMQVLQKLQGMSGKPCSEWRKSISQALEADTYIRDVWTSALHKLVQTNQFWDMVHEAVTPHSVKKRHVDLDEPSTKKARPAAAGDVKKEKGKSPFDIEEEESSDKKEKRTYVAYGNTATLGKPKECKSNEKDCLKNVKSSFEIVDHHNLLYTTGSRHIDIIESTNTTNEMHVDIKFNSHNNTPCFTTKITDIGDGTQGLMVMRGSTYGWDLTVRLPKTRKSPAGNDVLVRYTDIKEVNHTVYHTSQCCQHTYTIAVSFKSLLE